MAQWHFRALEESVDGGWRLGAGLERDRERLQMSSLQFQAFILHSIPVSNFYMNGLTPCEIIRGLKKDSEVSR